MSPAIAALCAALLAFAPAIAAPATATQPAIRIAIDAEFGIPGSTSAQAISLGARIAAAEINAAGGVLGRRLEVIERDNRAVPARSANNLRELAADRDVVAVLGGRYSPVVVEALPEVHRLGLIMLLPWSAADSIIDNDYRPSWVFRLSLRDSWALETMVRHAAHEGARKVGLLLPNTEWGRSSRLAAETAVARSVSDDPRRALSIVTTHWYNWGDTTLLEKYVAARAGGAQAILFVANDREGAILAREVAGLPREARIPLVTHWGITGGTFAEQVGSALGEVDLTVVQSFSFIGNRSARARSVLAGARELGSSGDARLIASPVGVAHAYDLVHLLAIALRKAGVTDRAKVRDALENLGAYEGLCGRLDRPFTPQRHEALSPSHAFMARYANDGAIERLPARGR